MNDQEKLQRAKYFMLQIQALATEMMTDDEVFGAIRNGGPKLVKLMRDLNFNLYNVARSLEGQSAHTLDEVKEIGRKALFGDKKGTN